MSSPEYLRFYDTTIQELAARGHDIVLAVGVVKDGKPVRLDAAAGGMTRVSVAGLVPPRGDAWTRLARGLRGTLDFVRYLQPPLDEAALLRARVKRQALPWTLQWLDRVGPLPASRVRALMAALRWCEQVVPPADALLRFVDEQAPDLLLVSPLVEPASDQADLVRAAEARGIRTGTLVASWDNLTNKGDLHVHTDFVAVWNEAQKEEAVRYHGVRAETVEVTGAQVFDRWFGRRPSLSREAFCRRVGLPADRPYVLFTGSSIFIARADVEMPFVQEWIAALRASGHARVRELGVLVRPHPYNGRAWNPEVLADLDGVAVWPRGGYDPVDEENRAGLFDALYHSAAVVGINTSAMIEAAIIGRPVFSIALPRFAGTQRGTLHYRHLLPENGGFLRVAATYDEHVGQLAAVLDDSEAARAELDRFVRAFIRPYGLDEPATPRLAGAIERALERPRPSGAVPSPLARMLRPPARLLAALGYLWLSPAERKRVDRRREAMRRREDDDPQPGRVTAGLFVAVAAPVLCAFALLGAFAAAESSGWTPLSYPPPRNIAEAAGMGIAPEVLRFLRGGSDPNLAFDVRPEIISPAFTRVTANEAAVFSRRVQLVRMLDREGAIPDSATRRHLECLAADIAADDIRRYLAAGDVSSCEPEAAGRAVMARSR